MNEPATRHTHDTANDCAPSNHLPVSSSTTKSPNPAAPAAFCGPRRQTLTRPRQTQFTDGRTQPNASGQGFGSPQAETLLVRPTDYGFLIWTSDMLKGIWSLTLSKGLAGLASLDSSHWLALQVCISFTSASFIHKDHGSRLPDDSLPFRQTVFRTLHLHPHSSLLTGLRAYSLGRERIRVIVDCFLQRVLYITPTCTPFNPPPRTRCCRCQLI